MAKRHNQIIATPEALVASLVSTCQEYTDEVREAVEEGIIEIGEEALQEVIRRSPVYEGKNKDKNMMFRRGSYRKSWKYTVDRERGKILGTVHAKSPHHRLVHLLENGHVNRDGTTRSRPYPHVAITNENAEKKVDKLLEDL